MHATADFRRRLPRLSRASLGGSSFSFRGCSASLAAVILVMIINVTVSSLALAECDEHTASRCQSEVSYCLAKCERNFHREEAIHACHQECRSNYASCRTGAQCK
jgi:hypothetical protein